MMSTESALLCLPKELRLEIWEYLLSPTRYSATWHDRESAITTITRQCLHLDPVGRAHDFNNRKCTCNQHRFYILRSQERLVPEILRVSRQVHAEALPCLYRSRLFEADGNRIYITLHDTVSDSWFIMDRWLETLNTEAKRCVRAIKIPMVLSWYEVYGAREALYSLSARLPLLQKVHLQVCPSFVREHWLVDGALITFAAPGGARYATNRRGEVTKAEDMEYWLGPVMAFANSSIDITAVDKLDLGRESFEKIKTALEMDVWRQLLPLRTKRDARRIRRIQRTLEAIEYSDVEGLCEETLTTGLYE